MPDPAPRARVGIIGQSFTVPSPRVGRLDAYPEAGHMRTSAMAEGAIDGEAESYEVAGPYANALRLLSLRRTEAGAAAGGAPGARNADGGGSAGCARRTRGGSVCLYVCRKVKNTQPQAPGK